MNLRAALLRQLTELKKDGVLGPNIILRKTMLDECKGDKFEELLAAFSIVVLKRVAKVDTHVKKENQIPLVLSYRKGIQRDLEKRKEIDLNARQQHRAIKASQETVSEQANALRYRKPPRIPENADLIRSILRENWIGDYSWTDTILSGTPLRSDDDQGVLLEGDLDNSNDALLEDLQARVKAQNAQLVKWQAYLKGIQQNQQNLEHQEKDREEESPEKASLPSFTRHQELRRSTKRDPNRSNEPYLKHHHSILLQSLEKELQPSADRQAQSSSVTPRSLRTIRPPPIEVTPLRTLTPAAEPLLKSDSEVDTDSQTALEHEQSQPESPTTPRAPVHQSLSERTRLSLANFETPRVAPQTSRDPRARPITRSQTEATVLASSTNARTDRSSLLERTRQSMSMLTNVLDDPWQSRPSQKPKKPTHKRSKTLNVAPQRGRLSRAWSEESLSSAATSKDDSFNVEADADYEDVFKSRPRLAMSPNLSPQRTDSDAWLESQLEQSMNKLTIESSPEY